ncbi:MAG: thiosulfohydrolase SoxB, partial [Sneathiella sp.]
NAEIGNRISDMTLLKSGQAIEASRDYTVAGWASVNEDVEGPAIYDLVSDYISKQKTVTVKPHDAVKLVSG